MKIIISPAKKMKENTDSLKPEGLPVFLAEAKKLKDRINGFNLEEQKALWACSDSIAVHNSERFKHMDPDRAGTPAILAYDGIQYTYMAPSVFEEGQLEYIEENLRILSGFYGVLRPMDAVVPYRLEMQAELCPALEKASGEKFGNLYDFWGDKLYRQLFSDEDTVINLASKEYSKAVEPYLTKKDRFISCLFCEMKGEKPTQKATLSKMARGEMVRYLAEHGVTRVEDVRRFDRQGYRFDAERSDECTYVFVNEEGKKQC